MGMIRIFLAALIGFGASAALAQDKPVSRPNFQNAMGLLTVSPQRVETTEAPFTINVPSSSEVVAREGTGPETAAVLLEFAAPGNRFLETVLLTPLKVFETDPLNRRFALANVLVVESFNRLMETYPDAKLLVFGPVSLDHHDGVHALGTYTHPQLGPVVVRLVGILKDDSEHALLAVINLSTERMPSRNLAEVEDTYSGWVIRTLKFDP